MTKSKLKRPRGFALKAAAEFYAGFTPGSGMAQVAGEQLSLAFRLDGTFQAVAVILHEDDDVLVADVSGTDDEARATAQVARMLGLDVDGEAWLAVGRRDLVVGKLQREFPGFFTAAKPSPYDAAAWAVICPRMNLRAAAKLKQALGEKHGDLITTRVGCQHVFPSPTQVLAIHQFPGLAQAKLDRLKGIARAALDGRLEAERLRAMEVRDALAELQRLPGVGPWTASHILFRGAALSDGLPTVEPRVLHGLADAYGLDSPTSDTLLRFAENWRPFRTWVCVLLARHLALVGGWNNPGLSRERAAAGRRAAH